MSLFAVLLPKENPELITAIKEKFSDNYQITSAQWIVSAKGTAQQISDALGISAKEHPTRLAVIFAIAGYWGRANADLWEWIKVQMEKEHNG